MDLRLLRYFLAVVSCGSLSGAARVVHVTEPSLSRQIRQLERRVGLDLFARESGRLALTPAGRRFVPIARDLVARLDEAVAAARALGDPTSVVLRVVAHATTIRDVVAPFVASGGSPLVLDIAEASTSAHAALVAGGNADLGVSAATPTDELSSLLVARFPLFAQVPPGLPPAGGDRVELSRLASLPLVVLDSRSASRALLDHAAAEANVAYHKAFEVGLADAAQALAASGQGVAIVSDEPRFGLVAVPIHAGGAPLTLPVFAIWRRDHYAADHLARLAAELTSYCSRRFPTRPSGQAAHRGCSARYEGETCPLDFFESSR